MSRGAQEHLLVPLQLLDKRALVEERLQPLLGVVVAELLEGGSPLALSHAWVLEARRVHDEEGAQRVLAGFQRPGEYRIQRTTHTQDTRQQLLLLSVVKILTP